MNLNKVQPLCFSNTNAFKLNESSAAKNYILILETVSAISIFISFSLYGSFEGFNLFKDTRRNFSPKLCPK